MGFVKCMLWLVDLWMSKNSGHLLRVPIKDSWKFGSILGPPDFWKPPFLCVEQEQQHCVLETGQRLKVLETKSWDSIKDSI